MRVLAVFIFMSLLFQTATLESRSGTDGTSEKVTDPESDLNVKPTSKSEKVTDPESDLNVKPTSKSEKVTDPESDLNVKPTSKLDKVTDPESDLNVKPTSKSEKVTDPESDLNVKPTSKSEKVSNSKSDLKVKPTPKSEKDTNSMSEGTESFLGLAQCLDTRLSCSKVFCPPWRRCIAGQCVCKMPYKCPRQDYRACTLDGSEYYSMCQAKAISCRSNMPIFSNSNLICRAEDKVEVSLQDSGSHKVVMIKTAKGKMFVCGQDWNMAAANVVCRNLLNVAKGAKKATKIRLKSLDEWPKECMRVRCTGSELSLAECTISHPQPITEVSEVAVATCYNEPKGKCTKFVCANGKCLNQGKPCNGVDDCGDNSDEMCCQRCDEKRAFHCKSDVCIPLHAVRDGIRDCLGGEDELNGSSKVKKHL